MGDQSKSTKRKQFSSEFKREAVRLVTEGGLSIAQAARDLGLKDNMVSRWKKEAEQNGQRAFPGQWHPQDEELSRLRREVEVLREEREILKKSLASFVNRAGRQVGDEGDAPPLHRGTSRTVST
jgi:transposase